MKQEEEKAIGVPENAFRELKPGEVYNPLMSPDKKYPEVNLWSVLWGIAMAVLFSAAAAYLGLKVGQVFEAAIPIAIIAVGVSGAAKRKNALGENVIIQSIGASSGVIVAGAIFTLPALYILQESYPQEITVTFAQVFISSLLGGVLGILFLIPFRKYFVEISFVFVADFGSNRIDCQSGVQQQFFGFLQTQMLQIFRISHSGPVFQ